LTIYAKYNTSAGAFMHILVDSNNRDERTVLQKNLRSALSIKSNV